MANNAEDTKGEMYGDEVREKILEFAEKGWDSIPEDERDEWFSRFLFWGVFHHRDGQESYFMMRLANSGGVWEAGQMKAIGEVAKQYARGPVENPEFGDAWIDFTTRQGIQMHWLKLEDVPDIWDKLEPLGVTSRSAGGDTMRNIAGSPVAGKIDEYINTRPILDELMEEVRGDNSLCNLPRKFNISVSGDRIGSAQDSINDIGLEPAHRFIDGEHVKGFNVKIGGGLGNREPREARPLNMFVKPEDAVEPVRAFVQLFHDTGNRENRAKNRPRFYVDERDIEEIREDIVEKLDCEVYNAGTDFRHEYTYNAGRNSDDGPIDYVGVFNQRDGDNFVGLSVPVGRMPADDVIELAELAETYGSGEIRTTRRQNPLIVDVPDENLDELLDEPLLETYSPNPTTFDRGSVACTGTEFCSLALTETKARLARMLQWLNANVELPDDVDQIKIHYSGCTADCGQAMTADIGLQGMRARKNGQMVEALDVGIGGGIGENPSFTEFVRQRVPADEVPGLIKNLVEAFAALREDGQTFREWVDATGHETLVELAEPEEVEGYEDPCLYDAKQSWYPFDDGPSPAPTAPDGTPLSSDD